jgi:hypothetical protein
VQPVLQPRHRLQRRLDHVRHLIDRRVGKPEDFSSRDSIRGLLGVYFRLRVDVDEIAFFLPDIPVGTKNRVERFE